MNAYRSQRFAKHYRKLPRAAQERINLRIALFLLDPLNPLLNNHRLHGEYVLNRSISVGGDLRIVYRENEDGDVIFIDIGTHHELYGK